MPIVQVHLIEGRTVEQKRKLVAEMTKAVVDSLDVKAEDVRIILSDMTKQDYSVGGVLFIDR
jgi:4-oxalocrotonate tautomerase